MSEPVSIVTDAIAPYITSLRRQRVIIDNDLAALYGVATKRLNEQVQRNVERFPNDFMFQLTPEEWDALRSQFATLKTPAWPASQVPALCFHRARRDHGGNRAQ